MKIRKKFDLDAVLFQYEKMQGRVSNIWKFDIENFVDRVLDYLNARNKKKLVAKDFLQYIIDKIWWSYRVKYVVNNSLLPSCLISIKNLRSCFFSPSKSVLDIDIDFLKFLDWVVEKKFDKIMSDGYNFSWLKDFLNEYSFQTRQKQILQETKRQKEENMSFSETEKKKLKLKIEMALKRQGEQFVLDNYSKEYEVYKKLFLDEGE